MRDLRRRKVLLVEDDPGARAVFRDWLSEDYEVAEAPDGEAFVREARGSAPDLVVMDVSLPGADGLQLTRSMRNDQSLRRVPVLVVTAKLEEVDFNRALAAGATGFLAKPVGRQELLTKVAELLVD